MSSRTSGNYGGSAYESPRERHRGSRARGDREYYSSTVGEREGEGEFEENDIIERHSGRDQPDWSHEDHGRPAGGVLVVKKHEVDNYSPRPREREREHVERDQEIDLGTSSSGRPRDRYRDRDRDRERDHDGERDRDRYRDAYESYSGPRERERERERDYEVDVITRRPTREIERERDYGIDYLRADYGRSEMGPLVMRERETATYRRPRRPVSPIEHEREVDHEVEVIKTSSRTRERERPIARELEKETEIDIINRARRGPARPREREREREPEIEIDIESTRLRARSPRRERELGVDIHLSRTGPDDSDGDAAGGRGGEGRHEREREIDIISRPRGSVRGSDPARDREIEIDIISRAGKRDRGSYASGTRASMPRGGELDTDIDIISRERERDRDRPRERVRVRPQIKSTETKIDIRSRTEEGTRSIAGGGDLEEEIDIVMSGGLGGRERKREIGTITRPLDNGREGARSTDTEIDVISRARADRAEREFDRLDRERDVDSVSKPSGSGRGDRSGRRMGRELEVDVISRSGSRGGREREIDIISRVGRDRSLSEEPVRRLPPLVQEIITHHRHIDHGMVRVEPRAPSPPPAALPSPSPLPEPPAVREEIEIHRRETRNGREVLDEEIIIKERETSDHGRETDLAVPPVRRRSRSRSHDGRRHGARADFDIRVQEEADYYARRNAERSHLGEAHHGHTRDWEIVDVPPGTERVLMNGIGGAVEEITWQRYNGVRRSEFIPNASKELEMYEDDRAGGGVALIPDLCFNRSMWTEITKDLVVKEAIEEVGYEFEETEFFFYVMEYLRYDDILELVTLSEAIHRQRRDRIRAMQWEREHVPDPYRPRLPPSGTHGGALEERVYEREVIYDYDAGYGYGYKREYLE